ncbi:SEC3 [Symbiodinium microadriaticum]|nr:SEC3 [Symbiodinium microadriaticum]
MQVGELPTCQKLEVEIETATRFIFCRSMLHIPDSKVFMKLLCPSIFQRLAIEPKDSPFLAVQVYGPQKPTVAESFRAWAGLRSAAFRRRGDASFIQEHQMICYADEEIGVLEISKTGNVIIQDRDVSLGPPCTMIEGGYALATSLQDKRIRNLKQDLRDLEPASEPSDREKRKFGERDLDFRESDVKEWKRRREDREKDRRREQEKDSADRIAEKEEEEDMKKKKKEEEEKKKREKQEAEEKAKREAEEAERKKKEDEKRKKEEADKKEREDLGLRRRIGGAFGFRLLLGRGV